MHLEGTNALVKCDNGVIFSCFINENHYILSESVSVPILLNNDVASESMKWHNRFDHI